MTALADFIVEPAQGKNNSMLYSVHKRRNFTVFCEMKRNEMKK